MNVNEGRFDVRSQPLFLNAISKQDTFGPLIGSVGGIVGQEKEFLNSGLRNEGYNSHGAEILPESDAKIRYHVVSNAGDVSVAGTGRKMQLWNRPGYLGMRAGVLPYWYVEAHGGLDLGTR